LDLIAERQRAWRQGGLGKSGQTGQKRQRKNSYFGIRRYYFFLLAVSKNTISITSTNQLSLQYFVATRKNYTTQANGKRERSPEETRPLVLVVLAFSNRLGANPQHSLFVT
jgi:hypothetical protein